MFILNLCDEAKLAPILKLIGYVVQAIMIGIPILLIIFGMLDLEKAVISSKEDEVKKASKAFVRRLIVAAVVFLVVWIVTFVFDGLAGLFKDDADFEYDDSWRTCWKKIRD